MKSEDGSVNHPPQSSTPPSSVTPSSSTVAQSLFFNNENFTSRLLAACQERNQMPQDMHALMALAVQNFQQNQRQTAIKNDSTSPASSSAEPQVTMSPSNTPHTAARSGDENASFGEQVSLSKTCY
jgi:hypothetical protein